MIYLSLILMLSMSYVSLYDLQSAINNAVSSKATTLNIRKGVYKINSSLLINRAKNLVIRGNGSTILMYPNVNNGNMLTVQGSSNLTIENLHLDYDPLPYTQGVVTKVVPNSYFEVTIHTGYRKDASAFGVNSTIHIFDQATRGFKQEGVTIKETTNAAIQVSPGVFRIVEPELNYYNIAVNDLVTIGPPGYTGYACAIVMGFNYDTHINNIQIYSAPGCGVLEIGGGGTVYDRIAIRRNGSRPVGAAQARLLSTNKEAFRIHGTNPGSILKNSFFQFSGTDGVILRSWMVKIMSFDSKSILFDLPWLSLLEPGKTLFVYDGTTFKKKITLAVTSQNYNPYNSFRTNVNSTANIAVGDYVICPETSQGLQFFNNTLADIDGTAVVAGGSNIFINRNIFRRLTVAAITIGPQFGNSDFYFEAISSKGEGDFANGVYIQNNSIYMSGYTRRARYSYNPFVGAINVLIDVLPSQVATVRDNRQNKNIFIQNNAVGNSGTSGLFVSTAENIKVCKNHFWRTNNFTQNSAGQNVYNVTLGFGMVFYSTDNVFLFQNGVSLGDYANGTLVAYDTNNLQMLAPQTCDYVPAPNEVSRNFVELKIIDYI